MIRLFLDSHWEKLVLAPYVLYMVLYVKVSSLREETKLLSFLFPITTGIFLLTQGAKIWMVVIQILCGVFIFNKLIKYFLSFVRRKKVFISVEKAKNAPLL